MFMAILRYKDSLDPKFPNTMYVPSNTITYVAIYIYIWLGALIEGREGRGEGV